jgi:hypothetical protein
MIIAQYLIVVVRKKFQVLDADFHFETDALRFW